MPVPTPTSDLTDFTLHFKCRFLLNSNDEFPVEAVWLHATQLIFRWVERRVITTKQSEFIKVGAFRNSSADGRGWQQHGCRVLTRASGEQPYPRFWTCQLEHSQSDFQHRRWRADIGLTVEEGAGVHVAIRVFHGLVATYIGPASAPELSAPNLVPELLKYPRWRSCLGSLRLQAVPTHPDSGKQLWDELRNPQRRGPVVVLAADSQGAYPLEESKLSRQLSGVAAVWLLPYEFQREFSYFAGATHYCQPRTVRVYQPGLHPTSESDGRRHRFLLTSFIDEQGPEQVMRLLVQSLIRQANYSDVPAIFSPADLEQQQRAERLEALRLQLEQNSAATPLSDEQRQYIALLEDSNQELMAKLQQAQHHTNAEELALLETNIALETQNTELQYKLRQLEVDNRRIKESSTTASTEQRAQLWDTLEELPTSIDGVLELAEQCWPERLAFTTRAKKSAKVTHFNDPAFLWRTLWHMAHTLHPLYFSEQGLPTLEVEKQFNANAPNLTLTHGETGATRSNAKLMKLRQDEYQGQPIDIEPHVKYGVSSPKLLRIHFHRDSASRRLIIGHCGDHLETHGTMYQ